LSFEEENVLLEIAQTKSQQEEAMMISITTSILEDIGQGNSLLVGSCVLVLEHILSDTTDSMLQEIFEPYKPITTSGAFSLSNCVYLTFKDGEHARSILKAFRDKEIFPGYRPTKIEFADSVTEPIDIQSNLDIPDTKNLYGRDRKNSGIKRIPVY
jgi:hypothetical protein